MIERTQEIQAHRASYQNKWRSNQKQLAHQKLENFKHVEIQNTKNTWVDNNTKPDEQLLKQSYANAVTSDTNRKASNTNVINHLLTPSKTSTETRKCLSTDHLRKQEISFETKIQLLNPKTFRKMLGKPTHNNEKETNETEANSRKKSEF